MKHLIALVFIAATLTGCEEDHYTKSLRAIDKAEQHALFVECMKLVPQHVASRESVVRDCQSYALSMAWDRARDRIEKEPK